MNLKKICAVALAAVTAVTAFSGCKRKSNSEMNSEEIMKNTYDESFRFDERVTIKIPVYDRGVDGLPSVTDNYWTKYVQTEFGDKHNITVEYMSIPRKEENTRFNQLLAGKQENWPSIIFNYDYPTIVSFADQGAFMTLDDEVIKHVAPTYYEKTKELNDYTVINGEKKFLAATRPNTYNYVTLVRKDWLDQCGLTVPETDEEYIDMLRAFRDKKPGGENTIPLAFNLKNAYYGNYGFRPYPMPEKENALYSDITVCALTYEPTKQQLKYDNMLYNEGLVSPNWYFDSDSKKAQEDFISGRAGVFGLYLSKTPDVIGMLKKNVPTAEVAFLKSHPQEGKVPAGRADYPFGMMMGITKACDHPEAVLMYLEWLAQPENLFVMQNGIENVTYTMDGEIPVLVDGYTGPERLNYNSNKDMWCLVTEGKEFGSEELNITAQEKTYAPEGYEYIIRESYEDMQKNKEYQYPDFIFNKSIESLAMHKATLEDKWKQIQTELVNCKPEEFDAKYEAACKEYLDLGYREVLEEKERVYNEMTSK